MMKTVLQANLMRFIISNLVLGLLCGEPCLVNSGKTCATFTPFIMKTVGKVAFTRHQVLLILCQSHLKSVENTQHNDIAHVRQFKRDNWHYCIGTKRSTFDMQTIDQSRNLFDVWKNIIKGNQKDLSQLLYVTSAS